MALIKVRGIKVNINENFCKYLTVFLFSTIKFFSCPNSKILLYQCWS